MAEIENAPQVVSLGTITLNAEEQSGIHSVAVAASVGVGLSSYAGIAVSGAGAAATNIILTTTNALIANSGVTRMATWTSPRMRARPIHRKV